MQSDSLRKAKIGQRVARELVAREGWTGTRAAFTVDRERAVREARADVASSGADHDAVLEGAAGTVLGRPVRTMVWSVRLARFVWWSFERSRAKWMPEGVERAEARKLHVELSDAHEGRSVEEVLAGELQEGRV